MTDQSYKPLIVVVGQIPPPVGGQNIMIEQILCQLKTENGWEVVHVPMNFNADFTRVRKFAVGKLAELFRVIVRLAIIRTRRVPDLIIYPFGGKHLAPVLRDLLLIPLFRMACKKIVVWFHTGGITEVLPRIPTILRILYVRTFRAVDAAIVMTNFNRRDPEALGVRNVYVVPHTIKDRVPRNFVSAEKDGNRLLYLGHLCPDKGVPQLLEAFSVLAEENSHLVLDLAGEPSTPWNDTIVTQLISDSPHANRIRWHGLVLGEQKDNLLRDASMLIFPSIAPGESFGLVLAEALMWDLPVVATDWRGNREVLGDNFFGAIVSSTPLKAGDLAKSIDGVLASISYGKNIVKVNRQIYQEKYCFQNNKNRISECIHSIVGAIGSRTQKAGQ